MAKEKKYYLCLNCNNRFSTWFGQCPKCGEWNSFEQRIESKSSFIPSAKQIKQQPVPITHSLTQKEVYFSSGDKNIDYFLGGGLVKGGVYLLGGEPGIGKSTWLLQLAGLLALKGLKTLYVSGEESLLQVKSRAERLGLTSENLYLFYSVKLEEVLEVAREDFSLIVIDSVQTLASSRLEALAGTPSQIREVALGLISLAKEKELTLFLVGHVTKEGLIAGPKLLEHMVDCVLYLEGDREHLFRLLRINKNRFGPNNEVLVLEMQSKGLQIIADPSTFFLDHKHKNFSGRALTFTLEGHKVLAVEVQALVNPSFLAVPRRVAQGIDQNRLNLLLAILEKRLKILLRDKDVYLKIGGGLKINDPALDLAICAALLSSFYDKPLPENSIFWGEVDLNGQIRKVLGHDLRLKQAKKLKYSPIFAPVKDLSSLEELQRKLSF